ncbi:ABC transporter permease [Terriglobus aquaticus]|uniref:ABC transporter permease n=1 Tax=Terriglobus aquaticus TaxID=940139 RepID=A0ABW9KKA1_9BACT|nr:ABC transporter permease [Terriglobus aquaticus]
MSGFDSISTVGQDVRYALRQLRRSPGFAITAIITIALGIGANTAIFTLAHAMILRNLPVTEPNQLYRVGSGDACCIDGGLEDNHVYSDFSTETYRALRTNLPEFQHLAAMQSGMGNGTGLAKRAGSNEAAQKLRGYFVSGNYFETFGVQPTLGRLLQDADDQEGAPPVAVISYPIWKNQFGADPSVVGATFFLDSHPVTVVGVAPQEFFGDRIIDNPPAFYMPLSAEDTMTAIHVSKNRDLRWLYIVGRVKPGTAIPQLQRKLDSVLRNQLATLKDYQKPEAAKELPKVHSELVSAATGVQQGFQNDARKGLRFLMAIAALVLLIACANLANLLLARGMARRAETSIRVAVGAGRTRILRQALTESIVLSLAGGIAGILLAYAGARAMLSLAFPEAHLLPITATPSPAVLLFTVVLAVLTGLLFGLAPAWSAMRSQPVDALRGLNRSAGGGATLTQRVFLVVQAMLSVVLLTVAVLLTRSLMNLQHQHFGLETADRIVLHLDPNASGYTDDRMEGLMRSLETRLTAIPGVQSIAFANYSPLEGNNWGEGVFIEGRPDPTLHDDIGASWDRVSPGFFATVGQPLLRGRDFQQTDRANTPLTVVVNQKFVRKFLPNEDPIGKRFGTEAHKPKYTIVGVVGDARFQQPSAEPRAMFFRSMLQPDLNADPKDMGEKYSLAPHAVLLRVAPGAQEGLEQQVRRAFHDVDSNLALTDYRSLDGQVAMQLNDQRMVTRLTGTFGLLALALAAIGLYGVTSYAVNQRVSEIGVRMALGASRNTILGMVVRGALLQTAVGLLVGVPAALLAGYLLKSQLFGVNAYDVPTLLCSCAVLAIAALLASLVPARRASSIDPMIALRAQ